MIRLVTLVAALVIAAGPARGADRLQIVLDWFLNPDHGPLVVARDGGYFEREGLEVELVAPADPNDPPKLLAAGRADVAVSYQPQLHLQVEADLPVARIGTLVATPLNTLIVLADGPVRTPAELRGRKVGYSVGGMETALLGAILENHGLALEDVELVNVNFSLSPALLSGQVDAVVGGYRNFELNQMELAGRPGRAFYPEEEGVPAYDELVYLARREDTGREDLKRFLRAVESATTWITNHPDEAWELFKKADATLDDPLNRAAWDDTWPRFAHRPAALDWGRYERFAAFLKGRGLIEEVPPVARYAVDPFAPR